MVVPILTTELEVPYILCSIFAIVVDEIELWVIEMSNSTSSKFLLVPNGIKITSINIDIETIKLLNGRKNIKK